MKTLCFGLLLFCLTENKEKKYLLIGTITGCTQMTVYGYVIPYNGININCYFASRKEPNRSDLINFFSQRGMNDLVKILSDAIVFPTLGDLPMSTAYHNGQAFIAYKLNVFFLEKELSLDD